MRTPSGSLHSIVRSLGSAAALPKPAAARGRRPSRTLRELAWFAIHLQGLDDLELRALRLVEIDGASYAEVGARLGLERAEVASVIARARVDLTARVGASRRYLELAEGA